MFFMARKTSGAIPEPKNWQEFARCSTKPGRQAGESVSSRLDFVVFIFTFSLVPAHPKKQNTTNIPQINAKMFPKTQFSWNSHFGEAVVLMQKRREYTKRKLRNKLFQNEM